MFLETQYPCLDVFRICVFDNPSFYKIHFLPLNPPSIPTPHE
ncbi:Hypothetical protein BN2458_PEG2028 [Helicobacter typhlonius]|uniref:Uncharacterized protein n=1 Tax=Helicobacter typhlonius TaxID=76936 RepID=A0A0S4PX70_9HELI|nr:Hypothetical protein BN2458_PEG2028 [Helicobacter typhlonius]